jgi:hypothetical protein
VGNLFDKLAKDAAADLPRREAFRRIGGGLLGVVLAAVGLAADNTKSACAQFCVDCCGFNFSHPRDGGVGQEYAECIRNCHAGIGTGLNMVCGANTVGSPCPPPA